MKSGGSSGRCPAASILGRATERRSAKKAAGTKATGKKATGKKSAKPQKDPEGGLTAEGRKAFAKREGAHLRPGVQGAADTPEKMKRKGSFLRRHFATPRGPMERDGEPTRLALSAHAWGEPVPKAMADAKKLAAKGATLLGKYHRAADGKEAAEKSGKTAAAKKSGKAETAKSGKKAGAAKSSAKKSPAKAGARKAAG